MMGGGAYNADAQIGFRVHPANTGASECTYAAAVGEWLSRLPIVAAPAAL